MNQRAVNQAIRNLQAVAWEQRGFNDLADVLEQWDFNAFEAIIEHKPLNGLFKG